MNMLRMLRRVASEGPHPLREAFVAWFITFGLAVILTFVRVTAPLRVVTGVLGCTGMVLGLTLTCNVGGAARFWAELAGSYRPFGVDYSGSAFAKVGFVRAFGAAFAAVGAVFVVVSVTQAT